MASASCVKELGEGAHSIRAEGVFNPFFEGLRVTMQYIVTGRAVPESLTQESQE